MLFIYTVAFYIIAIEAKTHLEIVEDFDEIPRDSDLTTLVIEGDEPNRDSIPANVFQRVPNLENLFIFNLLTRWEQKNAFGSLKKLQYLRLEGNDLERLGPNLLNGFFLEKLSLRDNNIEEIDEKAFAGLRVSVLDLSNNRLATLPKSGLRDLIVYKLSLGGNDLCEIPPNTFGCDLAYIDLSYNQFRTLDMSMFRDILSLRHLVLSHNKLTSFVATPYMTRLRILNLSFNDIHVIADDAFDNYAELSELHLESNSLLSLNFNAFPADAPLQKLIIDHNYLTYVSWQMREKFPNLKYVKFGANPWSCTCLKFIVDYFREHDVNLDECERDLIKKGEGAFCVKEYTQKKCLGNETQLLLHNFNAYKEFIKNYQC